MDTQDADIQTDIKNRMGDKNVEPQNLLST